MHIGQGRLQGVGGRDQRIRRHAHPGRLFSLAGALVLVLALAAVAASSAQAAEEASFTPEFSCSSVTFNYSGFPNANNNTVTEKVTIDGKTSVYKKFKFNGPTGSDKVSVSVPPGHHSLDAHAFWNTNGVKGGKDIPLKGGITCEPEPQFTIEKKQKVDGSKPPYTTENLPVTRVGEKIDYAIVVTNTGNVPMTFSEINDPKCDEGTITGGPGANPVAPGERTIFFCSHVLTEADHTAGKYCNVATDTGTPPEGDGPPFSHESNTVCAELPDPKGETEFSCAAVTYTYSGFPNLPGNVVTEKVTVDGKTYVLKKFTFNGSSGTDVVALEPPLSPGHHAIDAHASWNTHGFKGGFDHPLKGGITCSPAEPGFSIVDEQKIAGSKEAYTTAPLAEEVGQTIDYRITVTNTGNVPLTFSSFFDVFAEVSMENLTCTGGPGASPVAPTESTQYLCEKQLTEAGADNDHAGVTGTPPKGDGSPITHESNTVVGEVEEALPALVNSGGNALVKKAVTFTAGETVFEVEGGASVSCEKGTATGEATGLRTGTATFTYEGCKSFLGFKCQSGAEEGKIVTEELATKLVYINKGKKEVGIDFAPKISGGLFSKLECGGEKVETRGSVIGAIQPVNEFVKGGESFKIALSQTGGVQSTTEYEEGSKKVKDVLETSLEGGTFTQTGEAASVQETVEEEAKINA